MMTLFVKQVLDACANNKNIFIFISKDDEVDTTSIIKQLLKRGKVVLVPVCDPSQNRLFVSQIKTLKNLFSSTYNLLEPKKILPFPKKNIDIFFVPGTQFDQKGNRRGRGKGYFDRFLKSVKGKKKIIGLCFEHQVLEQIKPKPWDIPVDSVICCKTR